MDKEVGTTDDINDNWCKRVFAEAKNDPELSSNIDINKLLDKVENSDASYLENKTLRDISQEVLQSLESLELPDNIVMSYCLRLTGYRLVDRICDLRNGRMMRWIKINPETEGLKNEGLKNRVLTNGGILMSVKIENRGILLLCRNNMNRFFNVRFDDCLIYQKLTMDEQLIVMSTEYAETI
jgi:predicted HTH transcriptional regulator